MQIRWNQNGNWLLTASRDHLLKLFDIRAMKEMQTFRGHKREATGKSNLPFKEVKMGGKWSIWVKPEIPMATSFLQCRCFVPSISYSSTQNCPIPDLSMESSVTTFFGKFYSPFSFIWLLFGIFQFLQGGGIRSLCIWSASRILTSTESTAATLFLRFQVARYMQLMGS